MRIHEARLAAVVGALAIGFALQCNAQPSSAAGSGLGMMKGNYSGIFSGNLVGNPLQPFAGTGLFISDGKGNISGHETFNLNGNACNYTVKDTYTIDSDSTGTDDIQFINGGPGCPSGSFTQSLAVVDGGNLILLSNTNAPDVATEHWYRVSKRPR